MKRGGAEFEEERGLDPLPHYGKVWMNTKKQVYIILQ